MKNLPEWGEKRIQALEAALQRQKELTEVERRRADLLAAQVRVAFTVAGWPVRERSI